MHKKRIRLRNSLARLRRDTNKLVDESLKGTRPSTMQQAAAIAPAPRRRLRD